MTTTPEQIADLTKAHTKSHQDLLEFSDSLSSRVSAAELSLESWKANAFKSPEAVNNVIRGSEKEIDLTHLSSSVFYPVILKGDGRYINEYQISRGYSEPRPVNEFAGLFLKMSFIGHTWGGNPLSLLIDRCEQTYKVTAGAVGFVNYYNPVVFLRGGYLYHLRSNNADQIFTIYETQTRYYHNPASPIHDSNIGPVDEATVAASEGAIGITSIYNTLHTKNLAALGG